MTETGSQQSYLGKVTVFTGLTGFEARALPTKKAFADVLGAALETYALPSLPAVLEIGAGTGYLKDCMSENFTLKYISLDARMPLLQLGRTRRQLEAIAGDIHRLPFSDNSMDLIVAKDTMSAVHSIAAALREIARVLKPGGYFMEFDLLNPTPSFLEAEFPALTVIPGLRSNEAYGITQEQLNILDGIVTNPQQKEFVQSFKNSPWFQTFTRYHLSRALKPVIAGILNLMVEQRMERVQIPDFFKYYRDSLLHNSHIAGLATEDSSDNIRYQTTIPRDPARHPRKYNTFTYGVNIDDQKLDKDFGRRNPGKVVEKILPYIFIAGKQKERLLSVLD